MRLVIVLALLVAPPALGNAPSIVHAPTGAGLYAANCARCHGPNGEGASGPKLAGRAGAQAADFYLRTGYMPIGHVGAQPWSTRVLFSPREVKQLIAFVAALGGPPIPTPHAEQGDVAEGFRLFTQHCAGCHQVAAAGGYVTGARVPALQDADDTEIAEAVRIGPYAMPTFSARAITDRQLDSIIRYVDYTKHPDDRGGWAIGHVGPVPEGMVTWLVAIVVLVSTCLVIGRRLRQ